MGDEQKLTRRQAAILSVSTGVLCGPFRDVHKLAEELLERPVYTHELANKETIANLQAKAKPLLLAIAPEEMLDE